MTNYVYNEILRGGKKKENCKIETKVEALLSYTIEPCHPSVGCCGIETHLVVVELPPLKRLFSTKMLHRI